MKITIWLPHREGVTIAVTEGTDNPYLAGRKALKFDGEADDLLAVAHSLTKAIQQRLDFMAKQPRPSL